MAQSITMLVDRFVFRLSSTKVELSTMYKLSKAWHELVPAQYARITSPLRLISAKPAGQPYILLVGAHNNAVGSQFYYLKDEVVSKICTYFGRDLVSDIKIMLRPMSLPSVMLSINNSAQLNDIKILDQITDPELKHSLRLLYCSLPLNKTKSL